MTRFTGRFVGGIFLFIALFSTCEKVPDFCGEGQRYDPKFQFCFNGKAHNKCAGGEYNPLTEGCDKNTVSTICADGGYAPLGTPCGGYTLNTAEAPADGGSIIRSSSGPNYPAGEQVTLSAAAAAGYEFAGWAGASTSTSAAVTVTMDSNKPLVAMFRPTTATLATTVFPPDGGTIDRVENGAQVTVTAKTEPGHTFTGWEGAETSTEATVTVTVDEGKTLVAMFTPDKYVLTANITPANSGTVFVNKTASTGTTTHNAGDRVTALAQPAAGYEFTGWAGASTSAAAEITVAMDGNKTLTANFKQSNTTPPSSTQYTLTVKREPASGGTTSPESGLKHNANTAIPITASAASGYAFTNWAVTEGGKLASANSPSTTVTLTSNATVTANFRQLTVTPGDYTLTVKCEPVAGGTVFVNNDAMSGTTSYPPETQVTVRAEAAVGYRFTGWTGSLTSPNASLTVNMRTSVELIANFEYIGTRTLTVNRVLIDGGKVFVNNVESAGITTHTTGALVNVRAEAAGGYRFTGWSGASTSINTIITITMNNNSTLIANFQDGDGRGSFTDFRDDQVYTTVEIGNQTWMVENLNFKGHLLGDSWCYENSLDSCAKYGRLYDWSTAMDLPDCNSGTCASQVQGKHRGICPEGWHVPSRQEWNDLVAFAGDASTAGKKLKSENGWSGTNGGGTNEYGFSALPGGNYDPRGGSYKTFVGAGNRGRWWSATESSSTSIYRPYSQLMSYDNESVDLNTDYSKNFGYSVRCLKD